METVVSGTRLTGVLHLGNYYGAVRNYVRMQEDPNYNGLLYRRFSFVTTHQQPDELGKLVNKPLPHIWPVAWILKRLRSTSRVTCRKYLNSICSRTCWPIRRAGKGGYFQREDPPAWGKFNAGLLTYPVLMATDIIIHRAHKVPVGKDQSNT